MTKRYSVLVAGYVVLMGLVAYASSLREACLQVRSDCSGFFQFVLMGPVYLIKLLPAGLIMNLNHVDAETYYARFERTDQTLVVAIVSLLYVAAAALIIRLAGAARRARAQRQDD